MMALNWKNILCLITLLNIFQPFVFASNTVSKTEKQMFRIQDSSSSCDPGIDLSADERQVLLERIEETNIGKETIQQFIKKYGTLKSMILQWDLVSYSQIINQDQTGRAVASTNSSKSNYNGAKVCIHLTKKLPELEHLADLVHEMTHAIYLEMRTPVLEKAEEHEEVEKFVNQRIASKGGEAEAFAIECTLKREIINDWDTLCGPFAKSNTEMDVERIVDGLYSGNLSASLTGEPYPIMLRKQYRNLVHRLRLKKVDSTKNSAVK